MPFFGWNISSAGVFSMQVNDARGRPTTSAVVFGQNSPSAKLGKVFSSGTAFFGRGAPLLNAGLYEKIKAYDEKNGTETVFLEVEQMMDKNVLPSGWPGPDGANVVELPYDPAEQSRVESSNKRLCFMLGLPYYVMEKDLRASVFTRDDESAFAAANSVHEALVRLLGSLHAIHAAFTPGLTVSTRYKAMAESERYDNLGGESVLGSVLRPNTTVQKPAGGLHYIGLGDVYFQLEPDTAATRAAKGLPVMVRRPSVFGGIGTVPYSRSFLNDNLISTAEAREAGLNRNLSPYADEMVSVTHMDVSARNWTVGVSNQYAQSVSSVQSRLDRLSRIGTI